MLQSKFRNCEICLVVRAFPLVFHVAFYRH